MYTTTKNQSKKIVNQDIFKAKVKTMIEYGRKEITTREELEEFPIGSLISYVNKDNAFRHGGFIIKYTEEYFNYITVDFQTKYRVRYVNVRKMWVGDVYKVTKDIISLVATTQNKTNFPIKVDDIIVYYAKNNFDVKRYTSTVKYETMTKWCEYFKKAK